MKRYADATLLSRVTILVLMDLLGTAGMACFALLLRMEFDLDAAIAPGFFQSVIRLLPVHLVCSIVILYFMGCYRSLWQFAGSSEFLRVVLGVFLSVCVNYILMQLLGLPIPRSYPILNFLFLALWTSGFRLSYRLLRHKRHLVTGGSGKRTMLIGGGEAGSMILREFQHSDKSRNHVVCIIDDDSAKHGRYLRGVPIVGNQASIPAMVEKYAVEEIVFAIPTATAAQRRAIINRCQDVGCTLKTIPALYQLVSGEVSIQKIRSIQIEDLLGRDSIHVDDAGISEAIAGKTVLVTGGGGSIGSELCRQIAARNPGRLVIFDIYENNVYDLQQELLRTFPQLSPVVLIGSVRDRARLEQVFSQYRPQLIYHAAAHKHVPLMETSPSEAVKNNIFGTLNTAEMAHRYGAEKMVLISTDKAVNPTNIMGASKRVCEMVTQMVGRSSETAFVSVRFGNVLGSNGSVIPLFQRQISNGGPVTVTDKRIIRYFMTIPEAVSLVLQAGVFAKNGQIFVLDMGEPVKIDDLARNMIRLSGFEPDVDIPIVYTGLRPGEKLYEEFLLKDEGMHKTENDLIFIIEDSPFDSGQLRQQLDRLLDAADDSESLRQTLHEIVPEFREPVPV